MDTQAPPTWTADNGDGTFSNPLFYDEFSDPDLIRVGDTYYLTGTTMHTMPGLPILRSQDLVNWTHLCYAFDRLDLGPAFRLEAGQESYGQGIWAPSFRYHNGTFYIFSNVNHQATQLFRATDPAGPWTRTAFKRSFHDLSVLFDDDGTVYMIWGYQGIHLAQLNADFDDIVPGSERVIIPPEAGMGEGVHFYKIAGTYYIFSAWFDGRMRMPCARADRPDGPYQVNLAVSADEDFGLAEGHRLLTPNQGRPFALQPPDPARVGRMSLHQGGIVDTPSGEWWGFSMMDANSVGRLTCLSPVTWQDGWPYFGLPGNLTRTPRSWLKPHTDHPSPPVAPYARSDDFSSPQLAPIWQWNHVPDDSAWSLTERPGALRLHALPATDLWWARNTLTQRAIGPVSIPTAELDTRGMQSGDLAGLALLNLPYAWVGVRCEGAGRVLEQYDQTTDVITRLPLHAERVWLRAQCDFLTEQASFSYSTDGHTFHTIGGEFTMIFQLKTFQGVRYGLFHYSTSGGPGGYVDVCRFTVDQPHPRGLTRAIPYGQPITLAAVGDGAVLVAREEQLLAVPADDRLASSAAARFVVVDRGLGQVALEAAGGFVSVAADGHIMLRAGAPSVAETFHWTETLYGDLLLLALATNRSLRLHPGDRSLSADQPGATPGRADGACLRWEIAAQE